MFEQSQHLSKDKIDVQLDLHDGSRILGALFTSQNERLSDLLNDDRNFLPLAATNGLIIHLSKTSIAEVTQLDQRIDPATLKDPYDILGVPSNVTDDVLQEAYLDLVRAYHPDRIQAAGLPSEFVDIANSKLARVNDAHERIQAMRKGEAKREEEREREAAYGTAD